MRRNLVHLADESVDVLLTVTGVTTLDVVLELAGAETAGGVGQLEGPEEVVGLLEVGANGVDLVDQILHADNAELAEVLLDDLVVGEGSALLVDLSVTTLVQKLADGLQVGVSVGNVGVDDSQHLLGGLGETNESTRVDLEQTQKLEDLAGLGSNLVDTLDTDNEDKLGLTLNEEAALLASNAVEADLLALSGAVLLDIRLGTLEDNTTLLLVGLLGLLGLGTALSAGSLLGLALLQKGLGNEDLVLGGNGAVKC
eukprot:CAMPEP_0178942992 /NCGR_PEP_ID=MMETSP0789-20121207/2316_1 /TAXON_ID=3005 /ORGANISM="Rhizosolenia setigera, Strain CCMP 1694" /LENGTH=254 /DNA_ID=CAMNT_0020622491 /DNA_START=140 /DNA_END=904 /DNA_ORIENTATION=+